jgi:hypothetical protein
MNLKQQPWLSNAGKEMTFIMAPLILPVIMVLVFEDYFLNTGVNNFWWVLLVMGIDVSHVYSTLFRLYWDKQTFNSYKKVLVIIPLAAFAVGFLLHSYDSFLFWRVLAYTAVFHFVRQQYGFMRLYSRKEKPVKWIRWIDTITIYNATLYPLLYWHLHLTGKLSWFVAGDFIPFRSEIFSTIAGVLYTSIIVVYISKEIWLFSQTSAFNIPRNLIVIGTYCSWYVGIISFQGDLIFTLLNVMAHGIPYMALIWIYGEKKASGKFSFGLKGVAWFAAILLLLAYVEEYLWDTMVWRDHAGIFPALISPLNDPIVLSLIVPLLVLPQVTHYVLDGFIWRFSRDKAARIQ